VKIIFFGLATSSEEYEHNICVNSMEAYCKQKNIDFINFYNLLNEINFDFTYDMNDDAHVNVNGAKKITEYIGNYLEDMDLVIDRRNDLKFKEWHEYYEKSDYKAYYEGEVITVRHKL